MNLVMACPFCDRPVETDGGLEGQCGCGSAFIIAPTPKTKTSFTKQVMESGLTLVASIREVGGVVFVKPEYFPTREDEVEANLSPIGLAELIVDGGGTPRCIGPPIKDDRGNIGAYYCAVPKK